MVSLGNVVKAYGKMKFYFIPFSQKELMGMGAGFTCICFGFKSHSNDLLDLFTVCLQFCPE